MTAETASLDSDVEEDRAIVAQLKQSPVGESLIEDLVREARFRRFDDQSEPIRESLEEVIRYVEPFPRHAKRLMNRVRLLLFIAHGKNMLGGTPKLEPRHIGKWALLCERWPDLARHIVAHPEVMRMLEGTVPDAEGLVPDFDKVLSAAAPAYVGDNDLPFFCRTGALFGSVIDRLVRFESG
jgi:hypothetical protein